MNKKGLIGLITIIAIVAVLVGGGVYVYNQKTEGKSSKECKEAGEPIADVSCLSTDCPEPEKCCEGLISVYTGESENLSVRGANVCTDCGNGNCEAWENFNNCEKDCASTSAPDVNTSVQEKCTSAGGTWKEFGNSCADSCIYARNSDIMCAQVMTNGCDCGADKCYSDAGLCEEN